MPHTNIYSFSHITWLFKLVHISNYKLYVWLSHQGNAETNLETILILETHICFNNKATFYDNTNAVMY